MLLICGSCVCLCVCVFLSLLPLHTWKKKSGQWEYAWTTQTMSSLKTLVEEEVVAPTAAEPGTEPTIVAPSFGIGPRIGWRSDETNPMRSSSIGFCERVFLVRLCVRVRVCVCVCVWWGGEGGFAVVVVVVESVGCCCCCRRRLSLSCRRRRDLWGCATGRWDGAARPTCPTSGAVPYRWRCSRADTCRSGPTCRCDRSPPPSPEVAPSAEAAKTRSIAKKNKNKQNHR